MSGKKRTFDVGARVFAKVRGYPAWPARVETVASGGAKYGVFFYGTYESATCKANELWPFDEDTKAKFGKNKKKNFDVAMLEIEGNPGIKTAEMLMEEAQKEGGGGIEGGEQETPADAEAVAPTAAPAVEEEAPAAPATPQEKKTPARGRRKSGVGSGATPGSTTPAATGRGTKRKAPAEEGEAGGAASAPPPAAKIPRAAAATPTSTPDAGSAAATPSSESRTSRSGRVLKPKKFDDEGSGAAGTPKVEARSAAPVPAKKDDHKMYVQVKATGDIVEIDLKGDRPEKFDSREEEIQWERATAKNALKFKEKVESGEFIPDAVRRKIEEKLQRTPEEEAILRKEKQTAIKKEKLHWLKVEQRLLDIDLDIKKALHFERPDMAKCLKALEELDSLALAPLMLKKQPDIVTTIRKIRKYVGPQMVMEAALADDWTQKSKKIRLKANQIYNKLQNAFAVPEGADFWEVFETKLTEFRTVTKGMDEKALLTMVSDPTTVLEAAG